MFRRSDSAKTPPKRPKKPTETAGALKHTFYRQRLKVTKWGLWASWERSEGNRSRSPGNLRPARRSRSRSDPKPWELIKRGLLQKKRHDRKKRPPTDRAATSGSSGKDNTRQYRKIHHNIIDFIDLAGV